jgi:hypothetical protein
LRLPQSGYNALTLLKVPASARGDRGALLRASGSVDMAGRFFWTYAGADLILRLQGMPGADEPFEERPDRALSQVETSGLGPRGSQSWQAGLSHVELLILRSSRRAIMSR